MYIDNVEITPSRSYSLTDNEHIVKYIMKDNLNNCSNMFMGCQSLTSLDLSSFNTSNVTDMSSMFQHCNSLTSLNLSSFDTSNVTDMGSMFSYCDSLTDLNPFYNWKQGNIDLFDSSSITPLAVHQLIERSMSVSDGAEARTL